MILMRSEVKISFRNARMAEFSRWFKIDFEDFFRSPFDVSFDIFISACRRTIDILLQLFGYDSKYFLMFGDCLKYLQRVLKMIFDDFGAL